MDTVTVAALTAGAVAAFCTVLGSGWLLARAGFPVPDPRRRIVPVDGLRGMLALAVLVHHFTIWVQVTRFAGPWAVTPVHLFNNLGAGAVALFFMTTGFVFYPRVQSGLLRCSWPRIYIERLFRIVPLIAVSVALITVIIMARTGRRPDWDYPRAALQWLAAWREPPLLGYAESGQTNAFVLWSLYYEWLFYLLVLPLAAAASDLVRGRLPGWTVPLALLAGAILWQVSDLGPSMHWSMHWSMPTYLPLFAIGMLASECRQRCRVARVLRSGTAGLAAALLLAVTAMTGAEPTGTAMPAYALLFLAVASGNPLGGVLTGRAAVVLGECSYGIYILHGIALSVTFHDLLGPASLSPGAMVLLLPAVAAATVMASAAGFLAVERPMIRFGRRLGRVVAGEGFRAAKPG